jgi:hypothetical protein
MSALHLDERPPYPPTPGPNMGQGKPRRMGEGKPRLASACIRLANP